VANTFGSCLKMGVFGESHGRCVGVTVDGIPPGMPVDTKAIQDALDRRRPGSSPLVSARREPDTLRILSGSHNGLATGGPITLAIFNKDVDSSAYENRDTIPRPGHADYPAMVRSCRHQDLRGSGMFSGRMTAAHVMAGALVLPILHRSSVEVAAHLVSVGNVCARGPFTFQEVREGSCATPIPSADKDMRLRMGQEVRAVSDISDSIGASIECMAVGLPPGVGEPHFDSLESVISHAMFSIPAIKAIEFGAGFGLCAMSGSDANDPYRMEGENVTSPTNRCGGIVGGMSSGMPLTFRVAVKPTPSIGVTQKSVDMESGKNVEFKMEGRHDACIGIRAVPVVEHMTCFCLADMLMRWNNGQAW